MRGQGEISLEKEAFFSQEGITGRGCVRNRRNARRRCSSFVHIYRLPFSPPLMSRRRNPPPKATFGEIFRGGDSARDKSRRARRLRWPRPSPGEIGGGRRRERPQRSPMDRKVSPEEEEEEEEGGVDASAIYPPRRRGRWGFSRFDVGRRFPLLLFLPFWPNADAIAS